MFVFVFVVNDTILDQYDFYLKDGNTNLRKQ